MIGGRRSRVVKLKAVGKAGVEVWKDRREGEDRDGRGKVRRNGERKVERMLRNSKRERAERRVIESRAKG